MTNTRSASFPALGTTATLVLAGGGEDGFSSEGSWHRALAELRSELHAIDLAASRFRPDSELARLNAADGQPVKVSALMLDAVCAALRAARLTGGLVDPTIGRALRIIGYDRDFCDIETTAAPVRFEARALPGWQAVQVDRDASTLQLPKGVELDLGATAKALCADRSARRVAEVIAAGVLVSLGGDVAVAGTAPQGGWAVRIADDHAARPDADGPVVSMLAGGLATSSTTVRRWERGGQALHHVVDPATGVPASGCWRTVSVAAGTCLDANIASCASILLGAAAQVWLESRRLPARLVAIEGQVTTTCGWPSDPDPLREAAPSLPGRR